MLKDLESLVTPTGSTMALPAVRRNLTRRRATIGVVLAALLVVAWFAFNEYRTDRWLHRTALPELHRLIAAAESDSAFELALEIQSRTGSDSVGALWPSFARRANLRTEPAGVQVYRVSTADTTKWHLLGTTPVDSLWVPNRVGLLRLEKLGFRTVYSLGPVPALDSVGAPHPEMIRIAGGQTRAFLVGSDGAPPVHSKGMMRMAGMFLPGARETVEMMYEFEKPFVVDSSRFEATFGERATPLPQAIAATLDWYRVHPKAWGGESPLRLPARVSQSGEGFAVRTPPRMNLRPPRQRSVIQRPASLPPRPERLAWAKVRRRDIAEAAGPLLSVGSVQRIGQTQWQAAALFRAPISILPIGLSMVRDP